MKPNQSFDKSSDTPRNQFRTPSRPSPAGTSRTSKSTTSKRKASPGPIPARSGKRSSLSNSRAQSTLTQIDFVTQPTPHSDDEELDYIDETGARQNAAEETTQVDDGPDDDTDYIPGSRSRMSRTKFERNDDHPKRQRKSAGVNNRVSKPAQSAWKGQTPKSSMSCRGKRKSTEKPATKRDKTLTQMDFVRRYITIDDDDDNDVNMGYIQPDPQKPPTENEKKTEASESRNVHSKLPEPPKHHRRFSEAELDLSTGEPLSGGMDTQNTDQGLVLNGSSVQNAPVTPQKNRKLEIPSSQSPESPGLAIITSSQFRSATRSPSKRKPSNFAQDPQNTIKEESPSLRSVVGDSQGQDEFLPATPLPHQSPRVQRSRNHYSSPPAAKPAPDISSMEPSSQVMPPADSQRRIERTQRERTVIYETDDDSEHSDNEDVIDRDLQTPTQADVHRATASRAIHGSPEIPSDDSQELPLPDIRAGSNAEQDPPSEGPMSDASIYYQRMQPATQFPHEPIPTLNTQRLSELFPNEGNSQYPRLAIPNPSSKLACPFSQSQTQSQEIEQTEMVPESSPAREQENSMEDDGAFFRKPPAPESVVQVESSQPVDRGNHRAAGLWTRSQLLTSSVMESVPLPQFWMGSQDSVGEPYSLPDR